MSKQNVESHGFRGDFPGPHQGDLAVNGDVEKYLQAIANDEIGQRGVDSKFGKFVVVKGIDRLSHKYGPVRVYEGSEIRGFPFTVEPAKTNSQQLVAIPYETELPAEEKDEALLPSVREISEQYAEEDDADVESITVGPDGKKQVRYKPDKPVH